MIAPFIANALETAELIVSCSSQWTQNSAERRNAFYCTQNKPLSQSAARTPCEGI